MVKEKFMEDGIEFPFDPKMCFEVGKYDSRGNWFIEDNDSGFTNFSWECAEGPMGPWIAKVSQGMKPYKEYKINSEQLAILVARFIGYRNKSIERPKR